MSLLQKSTLLTYSLPLEGATPGGGGENRYVIYNSYQLLTPPPVGRGNRPLVQRPGKSLRNIYPPVAFLPFNFIWYQFKYVISEAPGYFGKSAPAPSPGFRPRA